MGEAILVLGGARSGKSRLAQRLATEHEPVTYLATATLDPSDAEMAARVSRHKADRPARWTTLEEPRNLADRLPALTAQEGSVLIDCVTLWLTNLMLGIGGGPPVGRRRDPGRSESGVGRSTGRPGKGGLGFE